MLISRGKIYETKNLWACHQTQVFLSLYCYIDSHVLEYFLTFASLSGFEVIQHFLALGKVLEVWAKGVEGILPFLDFQYRARSTGIICKPALFGTGRPGSWSAAAKLGVEGHSDWLTLCCTLGWYNLFSPSNE